MYAFDLIELDGDDLRREPLDTRKTTLASLLKRAAPGLRQQRTCGIQNRHGAFLQLHKLPPPLPPMWHGDGRSRLYHQCE
jgi:hypothetical protein